MVEQIREESINEGEGEISIQDISPVLSKKDSKMKIVREELH